MGLVYVPTHLPLKISTCQMVGKLYHSDGSYLIMAYENPLVSVNFWQAIKPLFLEKVTLGWGGVFGWLRIAMIFRRRLRTSRIYRSKLQVPVVQELSAPFQPMFRVVSLGGIGVSVKMFGWHCLEVSLEVRING